MVVNPRTNDQCYQTCVITKFDFLPLGNSIKGLIWRRPDLVLVPPRPIRTHRTYMMPQKDNDSLLPDALGPSYKHTLSTIRANRIAPAVFIRAEILLKQPSLNL